MLYTASFYAPDDWMGTLFRVSRGHPRGRKAQWGTLPFLYPPRELLVAYRSGQVDLTAFGGEYLKELESRRDGSAHFRAWLEEAPSLGDFTLLCFERAGQPCHRRVLARWLVERVPGLTLGQLR